MGGLKIFHAVMAVSVLSFCFSEPSQAFVAVETDGGVVELRSHLDRGLEISDVSVRRIKGKEWQYFCVSDKSSGKLNSSSKLRCFYALKSQIGTLAKGQMLMGIEHSLKPRLYNDPEKARWQVGQGRYFYPVQSLHFSY